MLDNYIYTLMLRLYCMLKLINEPLLIYHKSDTTLIVLLTNRYKLIIYKNKTNNLRVYKRNPYIVVVNLLAIYASTFESRI